MTNTLLFRVALQMQRNL